MHTGRHTRGFWRHLLVDDGGWIQFLPMIAGAVGSIFGGASKDRAQGRQAEAYAGAMHDRNALDAWQAGDQASMDRWTAGEQGAMNRWTAENSGALDRAALTQGGLLTALGLGEQGAMNRAQLDLDQRRFALDAPGTRARQALTGDMMARGTNLQISHPRANIPQMSGGYTFNDMGPEARGAGQALSRQALMGLLQGDRFDPVPMADFVGALPQVPGMTPAPTMTDPPAMSALPRQTPLPQASLLDKILGYGGLLGSTIGAIGKIADDDSRYTEYRG